MEKRRYANAEYLSGTAVRATVPERLTPEQEQQGPRIVERPQVRPQPKPRAHHGIDFFSLLLILGAIAATLYVCVGYLQVQADIVQLNKSITGRKNEISALCKENDALEAVLDTQACDLEYVYRIAVGTLGMVYPNNNEVIYYENADTGYFRQYQDIPEQ